MPDTGAGHCLQNSVLEARMTSHKGSTKDPIAPPKVDQVAPTKPSRLSEAEIESLRKDAKAVHERVKELMKKQVSFHHSTGLE